MVRAATKHSTLKSLLLEMIQVLKHQDLQMFGLKLDKYGSFPPT